MRAHIRAAAQSDRAAIEAIVEQAYSGYIARMGQKPGPMTDDYALLIAEQRVFVVEDEGAVQGLVVLIPETDAMLLDNVAVRPGGQGKGYGRMLLTFAEDAARDAGFATIRLYTHQLMIENIALYSRLGFIETARGEQNGFKRVFMAKGLESR